MISAFDVVELILLLEIPGDIQNDNPLIALDQQQELEQLNELFLAHQEL